MILVGLTGGIASGKSLVSNLLRQLGAFVIDADELSHEVIQPGSPAYQEVVQHFGTDILYPDETVDRLRLGREVFNNPAKRAILENIIHPRVFAAEEARRKEIARRDPDAVIIFDAPLLIETGAHQLMDKVILVYADRKTQLKRIMERDRLDQEEAKRRISAQLSLSEKKRYADYLVNGEAPQEAIQRQLEEIYSELKDLARQGGEA